MANTKKTRSMDVEEESPEVSVIPSNTDVTEVGWTFVPFRKWRILKISCSLCEAPIRLIRFSVAADGSVSPAVKCPSCNGIYFVKLQNWTGEEKKIYQIGF